MPPYRLEIVHEELKAYGALHVNQGEIRVSQKPMVTILRSCVCIGFYHKARRIGAVSHVTGFREETGHHAQGAIEGMQRAFRNQGIALAECACFVIGGTDKTRHVYDNCLRELDQWKIHYRVLDALGRFHRKLVFRPEDGHIILLKKSEEELQLAHKKTFHSDGSYKVFHDPKRRLVTGASLFFRNPQLLELLRRRILPELAPRVERIHAWCAGCSNGMEVYSLLMVALDTLSRIPQPPPVLFLGTDISEEALEQARSGRYRLSEAAQQTRLALFKRFTQRIDSHNLQMGPELMRRVSFVTRDIRQGSRRHRFEFVVCDHVLQYFDADIQQDMAASLARATEAGGYLYVSSPTPDAIAPVIQAQGLRNVDRHLYRRNLHQ